MYNFSIYIFIPCFFVLVFGCSSREPSKSNTNNPPDSPILINHDSLEYLTTLLNGRVVSMRMYAINPKDMKTERPPQPVTMRHSDDHGLTWSSRDTAFFYPSGRGVVYGGFVFADKSGNLHCFGVRYFRLADKDQPGHAILLHNRSGDGGKTWTASKQIDFGHSYTGSFNTVTELDNGRIILALSYTTEYLEERAERDFQIVTVHSDDSGDTWQIGSNDIKVPPGQFIRHPGALEPVMIQLKDQRVWMIIRTQQGRFFQTYSSDHGVTWSNSTPTDFKAPNAPTYVVRSIDGGRTWEAPNKLHDDWTGAIRDIIQTKDGSVIFTTMKMQHNPGHHAIITYTSKDEGKTWTGSNLIDLGGIGHHCGVIESTIEQLQDGRIWMLMRTVWGRFWEAFSIDEGLPWQNYNATEITASTAPGLVKRLASGRLALVYNQLYPEGETTYPLVGGKGEWSEVPAINHRKELSIRFSGDEGKSWSAPIVLGKTEKDISYPYLCEVRPGELWVTTWRGEFKARILEQDFL